MLRWGAIVLVLLASSAALLAQALDGGLGRSGLNTGLGGPGGGSGGSGGNPPPACDGTIDLSSGCMQPMLGGL